MPDKRSQYNQDVEYALMLAHTANGNIFPDKSSDILTNRKFDDVLINALGKDATEFKKLHEVLSGIVGKPAENVSAGDEEKAIKSMQKLSEYLEKQGVEKENLAQAVGVVVGRMAGSIVRKKEGQRNDNQLGSSPVMSIG